MEEEQMTDNEKLLKVIELFQTTLPDFWWSVGDCGVGAHASCGFDGDPGPNIKAGHPLDSGFHCDTSGGSPADALAHVYEQAIQHLDNETDRHPTEVFKPKDQAAADTLAEENHQKETLHDPT
jgi:hypothetical protein